MKRAKKVVWAVLIGFAGLQLYQVSRFHRVLWDEAVFIGMGKYLFSSGQLGLWEVIRPPGLPLFLGIIWKTGLSISILSRLLMVGFSAGILYMTYLLGSRESRTIGIIALLLMAATPFYFYYSSLVLTGLSSTFFALVALLTYDKKPLLAGIAAAVAFLFRFPQGLVLLGLLAMVYKKKESSIKVLIGFCIPVAIFFLFNVFMYGPLGIFSPLIEAADHQSNMVYSVIDGTVRSRIYNVLYYPVELARVHPLYILFIPGLLLALKKEKLRAVSTLVFVYLFYFTWIINKQTRFMLVFLPLIALLSAYCIASILQRLKEKYQVLVVIALVLVSAQYLPGIAWHTIHEDQVPEAYEVYTYFPSNTVILSTVPHPAALSDVLIIPMYDNVEEAAEIYSTNKEDVDYILYTPEFYPCFDDVCRMQKSDLFRQINATHTLEHYRRLDLEYYIFS